MLEESATTRLADRRGRTCRQPPSTIPDVWTPRLASCIPIGSADNASAARVYPRIFLQTLETLDMVQYVFAAPVFVYPLHVADSVACTASYIWNEDCETVQRQVLDQGHREPGEIRPLLSLRSSVNVFD